MIGVYKKLENVLKLKLNSIINVLIENSEKNENGLKEK